MNNNVIIYLHGFLSSPQSLKASQSLEFAQQNYPELAFEVPALDNHPIPAVDIIEHTMAKHKGKQCHFIGSSLGGFLSSYMVQKYGGKAVLINPAVKPFELLADYLGLHQNPYTKVSFEINESHIDDLVSLNTLEISRPQDFWVLLQTGDEVLNFRQAETKYKDAKLTIEPGGDHSFQHFERFLPEIFRFLLQD